MEILQIWIKNRLNELNMACINQVKIIYPDAKYTLVTDNIEKWPFKPDKIITKKEYDNIIYKECKIKITKPVSFSDYVRFIHLFKNENTLYLDCDVWCKQKIPERKKPGVWFTDCFVMYSGQSMDKIKEAFDSRGWNNPILVCCAEYLRKYAFKLNPYFEHKPKFI